MHNSVQLNKLKQNL